MVPRHVLHKMRAALIVASAASVGCTRAKVSTDGADAAGTTDGSMGTADAAEAGSNDASSDAADSLADDGGVTDAALDGSYGTIACPIHGSHLLLIDGGVQPSVAPSDLTGGVVPPGHRFVCLGCGMGGPRNDAPGTAPTPAPKGQAQMGSVTAPAGSDLARQLAGARARIRQCYQKGLESDPTMAGKILIHATFDANGEPSKVDVSSNTGLSKNVETCIASVIRRIKANGPADVTIPITFAPE